MHVRMQPAFTLIELVAVVAVVAILAAIALPSYQWVVRKSRRAEAQAALFQMYLGQERWRASHVAYAARTDDLPLPSPGSAIARYYRFGAFGTETLFKVQAAAIPGTGQELDIQRGTPCSALVIDQSGTRTPAACW